MLGRCLPVTPETLPSCTTNATTNVTTCPYGLDPTVAQVWQTCFTFPRQEPATSGIPAPPVPLNFTNGFHLGTPTYCTTNDPTAWVSGTPGDCNCVGNASYAHYLAGDLFCTVLSRNFGN